MSGRFNTVRAPEYPARLILSRSNFSSLAALYTAADSGLVGKRYQKSAPRARAVGPDMAHEIAKLLLEHAGTFLERADAVKSAVALGMPLHEIEEYLDWIDLVRAQAPRGAEPPPTTSRERPKSGGP